MEGNGIQIQQFKIFRENTEKQQIQTNCQQADTLAFVTIEKS